MFDYEEMCPHCGTRINARKDGRNVHDGYFWHISCLIEHLGQFHKAGDDVKDMKAKFCE